MAVAASRQTIVKNSIATITSSASGADRIPRIVTAPSVNLPKFAGVALPSAAARRPAQRRHYAGEERNIERITEN